MTHYFLSIIVTVTSYFYKFNLDFATDTFLSKNFIYVILK